VDEGQLGSTSTDEYSDQGSTDTTAAGIKIGQVVKV
jgi:hypothetical protein